MHLHLGFGNALVTTTALEALVVLPSTSAAVTVTW
jgi:hypothetical protein